MNYRAAKIVGLAIVAFVLHLGATAPRPQSVPTRKMLFAVWPGQKGKQPDSPIIDPVAVITQSGFEEPLNYGKAEGKEAEAMYDSFEKTYLPSGQKYPLLFGGSQIGIVEIQAAVGISCESLTATVKQSAPIPNAQRALAITSVQGLGLHTNWRQANTSEQRSEFLNAAASYLAKQGVTGVLPSAIKLRNLRLTKLRADGPNALVGSITVKNETTAHNLFLVIEQEGTTWRVAMASYHIAKDLADYVDVVEEDFVDQLDLEGDGVDEIVTISFYYESWDFAIYKKNGDKWEKAYSGGGGGC
jgi:hypothetical protein